MSERIKSGDLVKNKSLWHDYGVGLMIRKTGKLYTWGMRDDPDEHMRWWVHWTNPGRELIGSVRKCSRPLVRISPKRSPWL